MVSNPNLAPDQISPHLDPNPGWNIYEPMLLDQCNSRQQRGMGARAGKVMCLEDMSTTIQ
eukprot:10201869-Karenia_brevis.AAC.1